MFFFADYLNIRTVEIPKDCKPMGLFALAVGLSMG